MAKIFIYKVLLLLFAYIFLSCSAEQHTVDGAIMNKKEIMAISTKLFLQGNDTWELPFRDINKLDLTDSEKKLLRRLHYTDAALVYEDIFNEGNDSIVIFLHNSSIAHQHSIYIDMKKRPRKTMPDGCKRILERIYYDKAPGGLRTVKIIN